MMAEEQLPVTKEYVKLLVDSQQNIKGEAYIEADQVTNLGNLRLVPVSGLHNTPASSRPVSAVSGPGKTRVKARSEFPCLVPGCGSVLSRKKNLTRHMEDSHGPKVVCIDCGREYTKASSSAHLILTFPSLSPV